jgi:2-amino-4-hydroxy-6-hydroxymethyldihydropteridine diphosphokinase
MNSAVIGLGSNINPQQNMARAVVLLQEKFEVKKICPWRRTSPIGIHQQPDFLNGALRLQTSMDLQTLKVILKQMEDQMGRDRSRPKYGPREIDLDVLLWNKKVVDEDYYERPFLQELVAQVI